MYFANAWAMVLEEDGESNPVRGDMMCLICRYRAAQSEEQKRQHDTRLKQAGARSSACKHVEDYGPHPK